ncbi:hypothetical protein F2Q70_00042693 [Brassica cretica]|uniref:Uncharacterized protein n=1 Tax=Brassica cretica TaxID=69181 RepID=A0A8S9KJU5_BRACR|nr:hypothetical protein F2Q70_00042693 [Brassica cretica]
MDHRLYAGVSSRPTSSSMSSTVESSSGPRSSVAKPMSTTAKRYPRTPPVVLEDCHSDCGSSSSVIDDGDDDIASSSRRRNPPPFKFDLNFPPLDDVGLIDGVDDLCTDLLSPVFDDPVGPRGVSQLPSASELLTEMAAALVRPLFLFRVEWILVATDP